MTAVVALAIASVLCAQRGSRAWRRGTARPLAGPRHVRLRRLRPPARFVEALERSDIALDAATTWTACVAALAVTATVAVFAIGAAAVVVVAAELAGGLVALRAMRNRRGRAFDQHLPEALEVLARSLRAGESLHGALADAAQHAARPVADDLLPVVNRVRHGEALTVALDRWVANHPIPSVRLAAASLVIAAETGGATAKSIDGVAASLRQRSALDLEIRALSSQARMSAVVVGAAPAVFALFAAATDPRFAATLFHTRLGVALLAAGLALEIAGGAWMATMIRRAEP